MSSRPGARESPTMDPQKAARPQNAVSSSNAAPTSSDLAAQPKKSCKKRKKGKGAELCSSEGNAQTDHQSLQAHMGFGDSALLENVLGPAGSEQAPSCPLRSDLADTITQQ